MDFKFQDDKLESASNRRRWKRQIQLVLRHRAVIEVAIRKKIAPSAPPAGSYVASSTNSMNDVNVELMATSKSPSEIWHNLVAVKEQSSGQRVDRLMEEFLKCVRNLNEELERLTGTELPDMLLMSRNMSTLPQEYFEFKIDWESGAVGEPYVNLLIERLRLIEMRLPEERIDLLVAVTMKTDTKENVKKAQKNVLQMSSDWTCHQTLYDETTTETHVDCAWLTLMPHIIRRSETAIPAFGRCIENFKVFIKGKWILKGMEDVWYVPKLVLNMFSIGKAAEKGFKLIAYAYGCSYRKNGCLKLSDESSLKGIFNLHMRLVLKNHVMKVNAHEAFCIGCIFWKHHHEGVHSRKYSPKALGKLIHADLYALYPEAEWSAE
ncbi:hypothetical protein T07_13965 [Trichinella nelsoni]|uniref:Uncharacterized protein n=1 Tax=Trichinella nelsoni TaxID=6336 RepID=A0A0V0RGN3_9BILA|nr:hypothetical protein T07_13755 [Trichinella nelsoni]KRX13622.1 hypothetical protein T07_13965 [Trichinella nelsoni]